MATKKISELEAINVAEDNDVLVIVDTSESTTNKITKGNLLIGAGHTIEMTLNENYQIVLVLKNAAGTALSTQTIDLPNENAITNLAYNNGVLTITKQSGATSQINLTGLIEGLVTENDFNTFKEALQTILEAINEKDAEQDEAIAENYKVINKLNEKLENQQKVIDQLPQVVGQETSITLENTIEAPFTIFDVEGNSTQETTEGYQLLNPADFNDSLTNNGITFTNNGDGSITINGTSTGTAMLQLDKIKKTLKAGKYTFSLTNGIKDKLYMIWSAPYNSTNTIGTDMLYKEVTFDSDTELTYIYIQIPSGHTFNNVVVYPMIYEGSYDSSKPWEKYTGGIASPNPNYEQPIKSAGDNENLFDTSLLPITKNGVTISKDSKGNVVLNGTPTITSGYIGFDFTLSSTYLKADTYTISVKNKIDGIGTTINQTTPGGIINLTMSDTAKVKTGKLTADLINGTMGVNVRYDVGTLDNFILNPKLEKCNKATPYSPYGMGSINEKIQTRNFIGLNNLEQGTFNGNGEKTNDVLDLRVRTKNKIFLLSGKYTINVTNMQIVVYRFDFNNILYEADRSQQWKSAPYTFTMTSNGYVNIAFKNLNGTNITPTDVIMALAQLEPGSTATPYVPHEEQDYSIFVQQPIRSNKDKTIKDKFVIKSDNKKYERHWIGEVVLNGTEEVYLYNDNGSRAVFYINVADLYDYTNSAETPELLSNRFRPVSQTATWEPGGIACRIGGRAIFFIFKTGTSVNEFKNWLSTHNVVVQYLLAEPLDLPCTPEQVEQIENKPSTYKDFTIIQSEDETEAYLEVSGIRDIDTMFDKVTNAIVSLGGNV